MEVVLTIVIVLAVALVWGAITALLAPTRNYRRSDWLVLGALFGPIAILALFTSGKGHESATEPRWGWLDPDPGR